MQKEKGRGICDSLRCRGRQDKFIHESDRRVRLAVVRGDQRGSGRGNLKRDLKSIHSQEMGARIESENLDRNHGLERRGSILRSRRDDRISERGWSRPVWSLFHHLDDEKLAFSRLTGIDKLGGCARKMTFDDSVRLWPSGELPNHHFDIFHLSQSRRRSVRLSPDHLTGGHQTKHNRYRRNTKEHDGFMKRT